MRRFLQRRTWTRAALATALALLAACSSPPTSATSGPPGVSTDDVAIAHIDHRYMTVDDFRRISEYFTGKENTSGRLIERTDPAQRNGYYFIVGLVWHPSVTLPAGTQVDVDYIRNDDPATRHAHFVFGAPAGTFEEILLGLTGADWPDKNARIVSYKVTFKDAAGQVLADRQSFLWSLPQDVAPTMVTTTLMSAPDKP